MIFGVESIRPNVGVFEKWGY